ARPLDLALLAARLVRRRRRDPLRDLVRAPARRLAPLDVLVLPLALCAFHTAWWLVRTSTNFVSLRTCDRKIRTTRPLRRYAWVVRVRFLAVFLLSAAACGPAAAPRDTPPSVPVPVQPSPSEPGLPTPIPTLSIGGPP